MLLFLKEVENLENYIDVDFPPNEIIKKKPERLDDMNSWKVADKALLLQTPAMYTQMYARISPYLKNFSRVFKRYI
jgi:hypothetical protein